MRDAAGSLIDHRLHNMAHGTVGIAYALAAVGAATDRADLVATAMGATCDVLSLSEDDGGDGFLVHHSDPQLEGSERYSYGWCHGPTGDTQLFRLLAQLQLEEGWNDLVQRCWRTVVRSGIPERIRPGFWDNNGHCCGTAGVLAVALDLHAGGGGDLGFAETLVADLHYRATIDRRSTPKVRDGRTSSTETNGRTWNRRPAGRTATRASSASCCAPRLPATVRPRPSVSRGLISRRRGSGCAS